MSNEITVWVVLESSVHNEADDGGSQYDACPVSRLEVHADRESAVLRAEELAGQHVAEEGEDVNEPDFEFVRTHDADDNVELRITNHYEHKFVTVDRRTIPNV